MVSPKVKRWIPFLDQNPLNQGSAVDKAPTARDALGNDIPSQDLKYLDASSENKISEASALPKENETPSLARNTPGKAPAPKSSAAASEAEAQTSLSNHKDQKLGFDPLYKQQEGEYPDEDEEFIKNTRKETPMEDVVKLKYDYLFQRDQVRQARKETAELKATLDRPWQEILIRNKERAKQNSRRKPKPPVLDSISHRYLYDNTLDRLRESTVHVILRRAREHLFWDDYLGSEHHAKQALKYAAVLDYEPLSAWCHFHIGKARYEQKRYGKARRSFTEAEKAGGFYVTQREIGEWTSKTKSAIMRQAKRETGSAETETVTKTLEDELMGRGHTGSPKEFV